MARLNEPPAAPAPSAETIDAVKRRFLRQNRELAKTNSQQSIRIRNLEYEGSRLLAENLSLREQVLQLQNTLESQPNHPSFETIEAVRERFEAKIQELGSLVAELGHIKKADAVPRCKSQTAATKRSPDERQWRSGLGLQDVENAMLPTIVEDKHFPRRTMNADEIQGILDDPDSQSPDLGPPPIARFDNEEPIAFNLNPPPEESLDDAVGDPDPAMSINLETRKKRRESGPKLSIRRVSVFQSPPDGSEETSGRGVRAGAKRKLSVREDEESTIPDTRAEAEDFRFSRRNTPNVTDGEVSAEDAPQPSPARPVLGAKPVNTDPVLSPKKQRASTNAKPDKKPTAPSKSGRGRPSTSRGVQRPEFPSLQTPSEPRPTAEIHLDALPPKTPAVEGVFSPPSTEPSTSRAESTDTPPPADLSSTDQTGRPSRRARAQVSYKEPSLATKMRRPGKELVDAVVPQNDRRTSVEPPPTASRVKSESSEMGSSWKNLPAASARGADEENEVGSPLREKLGRKEGTHATESTPVEPPKLNSSAASNAISALIAGTSTSRKKVPVIITTGSHPGSSEPSTSAMGSGRDTTKNRSPDDNLAIFDFTDSPPTDDAASTRPRIDLAKTSRNGRRHSSVSESIASNDGKQLMKNRTSGSLPSLHTRTGSNSSVRSGTTSNLASTSTRQLPTTTTSAARETVRDKRPTPSFKADSNGDSKPIVEGMNTSDTGNLRAERAERAERAASRRRSMML